MTKKSLLKDQGLIKKTHFGILQIPKEFEFLFKIQFYYNEKGAKGPPALFRSLTEGHKVPTTSGIYKLKILLKSLCQYYKFRYIITTCLYRLFLCIVESYLLRFARMIFDNLPSKHNQQSIS